MPADVSKDINSIKTQITAMEKSLKQLKTLVTNLESSTKVSYREVEGVMGIFDGYNMITEDGSSHEVNPNYAAKSMLVYGDSLKMIEEGERKLFKQVEKVDRLELEGTASKKDGKWHVLTEKGSFVVSDAAAEFKKLQVNDKVVVQVPAQNLKAPFATLDRVIQPVDQAVPPAGMSYAPAVPQPMTTPPAPTPPVPVQPEPVAPAVPVMPAGDIPLGQQPVVAPDTSQVSPPVAPAPMAPTAPVAPQPPVSPQPQAPIPGQVNYEDDELR